MSAEHRGCFAASARAGSFPTIQIGEAPIAKGSEIAKVGPKMRALACAVHQRYQSLSVALPPQTASSPRFLLFLALLSCAHAALGVLSVRFQFGFGSVTYIVLSDAASLGAGKSLFQLGPIQPFGYSLVIYLLSFLARDLVAVALVVNVIANALSLFFVLAIAARMLTVVSFIYLTLILVLQYQLLSYMTFIWIESVFALSISAFFFAYVLCFVGRRYSLVLLCSVLATVPIYFRYIGVFVLIIFAVHVTVLALDRKISFKMFFLTGALCVALVAPLIIRNLMLTGGISGHSVGVAPAYTFFNALRGMSYSLAENLFYNPEALPLPLRHIVGSSIYLFTLIMAVLSVFFAWARREPAGVLVTPFVYLLSYAIAESITRIDLINVRFVFPVVPIYLIVLLYLYDNRSYIFRSVGVLANPLCTLGAVVVLVGGVASGAQVVIRGSVPYDFHFSRTTINRALELDLRDKGVLVNRFGEQLSIYAPLAQVHQVPYADPGNANYMEIYGIKPWVRDDFVHFVREHQIRNVIFFLGRKRFDPYLNGDLYGAFMRAVFDGSDPIVERVEALPDGAIIWLRDPP